MIEGLRPLSTSPLIASDRCRRRGLWAVMHIVGSAPHAQAQGTRGRGSALASLLGNTIREAILGFRGQGISTCVLESSLRTFGVRQLGC